MLHLAYTLIFEALVVTLPVSLVVCFIQGFNRQGRLILAGHALALGAAILPLF